MLGVLEGCELELNANANTLNKRVFDNQQLNPEFKRILFLDVHSINSEMCAGVLPMMLSVPFVAAVQEAVL